MIFFLSDFGTRDAYAGVVEAVIAARSPEARVVHLTHGVPPQDLRNGSWQLFAAAPHLPDGSIVLAVVDPGVGTARRAVVARGRLTYVAPDNGLLEAALSLDPPARVHEISPGALDGGRPSRTFHGRDVFGPAAAHLAAGGSLDELGPPRSELAGLGLLPSAGALGEVWTFDHFGNVITTLSMPEAPPERVSLAGEEIPFVETYGSVPEGRLLALEGSSGLIEVALRGGSARRGLSLRADASYLARRSPGGGC